MFDIYLVVDHQVNGIYSSKHDPRCFRQLMPTILTPTSHRYADVGTILATNEVNEVIAREITLKSRTKVTNTLVEHSKDRKINEEERGKKE